MPTFINPAEQFDDLVGFFEISADEGGVHVDADLCRAFAEGLADLAEKFEALVDFARASGLVDRIEPVAQMTAAARAELVRSIAIENGVLLFPASLCAPALAERTAP